MNNEFIKRVVQKLTTPQGRDYTYLTLFFLIFSVFVFAAIRPSLKTAFALKQEQVSLAKLNEDYETTIERIIDVQLNLEKLRDRLPLLSDAIPQRPHVNKLISDIEAMGAASEVSFTELSVAEVNLKEKGSSSVKTLEVKMEASASFPDLMKFLSAMSLQRRIKLAREVVISTGEAEGATSSGTLKIVLNVDGYHL